MRIFWQQLLTGLCCLCGVAVLGQTTDCFYGTTFSGGAVAGSGQYSGVIFQWEPVTNTYTIRVRFSLPTGTNPAGSPTLYNGKYYGHLFAGGAAPCTCGTVYEWDPATDALTVMKDMTAQEGQSPVGDMVLFNGKFYSMSFRGGSYGYGVIFEWEPATGQYTVKHSFEQPGGTRPYASLVALNEKFYSTTTQGGTNNLGAIFEWNPSTNAYVKRVDLSTTTGSKPYGGLTHHNGKFYGMTTEGGSFNGGVIYEWDPLTNGYVKRHDFALDSNGYAPHGRLTMLNGKFYGMTSAGGQFQGGVIFEWDPVTNAYTKMVDFFPATGHAPLGSLTYANGKFYGMTEKAGVSSTGSIFEWAPATNIYSSRFIATVYTGARARENNELFPGPCMSVLPLRLIDFKVRLEGRHGLLAWTTADEQNTDYFSVERSRDARWFEPVGRLPAKGNLSTANSYLLKDTSLEVAQGDVFFYRLKQADKDGTFTYSKIIRLDRKTLAGAVILLGNPVSDNLMIATGFGSGAVTGYAVMDALGRVIVQKRNLAVVADGGTLSLPVATLKPGIYYFVVQTASSQSVLKFIKQ